MKKPFWISIHDMLQNILKASGFTKKKCQIPARQIKNYEKKKNTRDWIFDDMKQRKNHEKELRQKSQVVDKLRLQDGEYNWFKTSFSNDDSRWYHFRPMKSMN